MPDAPVAPAPAAPSSAAPAAAPATPSTPAAPPSAPPTPPSSAAPAVVPAAAPAAAAPATPAKFDPKTAIAPPKSSDYPDNQEGLVQFTQDNTQWSLAHPDEAAKLRTAKLAAEDGGEIQPEATMAEAVAAAEAPAPAEVAKPAEAAPAAAATPAAIDQWVTDAPELKAVFEKYPKLQEQVMETARGLEAAKPVLDIVSTVEEANFAVEHAQILVNLQSSCMLAAHDPEMLEPAWGQVVDLFKERDAQGNEVKGPDGKAVLGADFKPVMGRAAKEVLGIEVGADQARIDALKVRLAGNYPNEEARTADATALQDAEYSKAAFDYVLDRIGKARDANPLPELPAGATPEQIAYQERLVAQQKELDAKQGKQTVETRRAAAKALDREVQNSYEQGMVSYIDTEVASMKERGEYLPAFVLEDKWINPVTQKVTALSDFNMKIYQKLNDKINKNPLHVAKLGSLQAMGQAGKDARIAEVARLRGLYLPAIFKAEVKRIQDGIRATGDQKPPAGPARVEPQSQGTIVPQGGMDKEQARSWAEQEAAKDPGFANMTSQQREQLIITLEFKKRYGQ